jgi:1-deoxy-D-xylulose-5-phosphate reductoisomerase
MKRIAVLGTSQQTLDLVRTFPDRFELTEDLARADLVVISSSTVLAEALGALESGKPVVLATGELMVIAGERLMVASREHAAPIIPADPALSAIWQCLRGEPSEVKRLVLSASDGLAVTGAQAITAHHLFAIPYERMEVVTHPQGVVHAMVEFDDGSMKAVFAEADSRRSLQHALSYPERWEAGDTAPVDLVKAGRLTFEPNPCLDRAIASARACYPESPEPIVRGVV